MSWNKDDIEFLRNNVGMMTYAQIAEHLGRTENAVHLYCFRYRISPSKTSGRNLVIEILTMKFVNPEYFQPTRQFFDAVKINQRRWWDLYFGRKKLTDAEYLRLINHLGVSLQDGFDARQLNLFEHD